MSEVVLPWPPRELSPNGRAHWTKKAKAARAYRQACYVLALQARIVAPERGRIPLTIEFLPPDRRPRDDDNIIAAFKAGRDGLADALGVNDCRFQCTYTVADQIGGMVRVRLA